MRPVQPSIATFAFALTMLSPVLWAAPPEAQSELIGRIRVEWRGLDLQNAADARTLLARIEKAAYRACGGNPKFTRSYELMPNKTVETYEACREGAVKRAVEEIGSTQLARVYEDKRQNTVAGSAARPPTPNF